MQLALSSRASASVVRDTRQEMTVLRLLVLVLVLKNLTGTRAWLLPNHTNCPSEVLVDVTDAHLEPDGSALAGGMLYPPDTIEYISEDEVHLDNSTSYRLLGCPCQIRTCLSVCCFEGMECNQRIEQASYFPVYDPKTERVDPEASLEDFLQISWDPCNGTVSHTLDPKIKKRDRFKLMKDGTLRQVVLGNRDYRGFCVGKVQDQWRIMMCSAENSDVIRRKPFPIFLIVAMFTSIPFLIATFCVYLLIDELWNIHGMTLCAHNLCLIVGFFSMGTLRLIYRNETVPDIVCTIHAYIVHFSFLASFFWLNVMCFDIWWTFGGFRSLQGSQKQRERKKFIMYSIYAWGCASLITITCMIVDLAPWIPETFIKPEFGVGSCWFGSRMARFLYFYLPMGITVICNICLFMLTAFKILRHKKDTARQLKGSESRRHDDNKQWFNLYLKLFIVMGINWSTEIISWLLEGQKGLDYVWYITDLANTLQGVIIFVIFVWKDKIKRLLLKRFGCSDGSFLSRNSTSRTGGTGNSIATSRTCVTTTAPLQEKTNPYTWRDGKGKTNVTFDESDGV